MLKFVSFNNPDDERKEAIHGGVMRKFAVAVISLLFGKVKKKNQQ